MGGGSFMLRWVAFGFLGFGRGCGCSGVLCGFAMDGVDSRLGLGFWARTVPGSGSVPWILLACADTAVDCVNLAVAARLLLEQLVYNIIYIYIRPTIYKYIYIYVQYSSL
jgi:hypothetical protein